VLVDTDGGNNVLYLPLDQLMQRRTSPPALESPPQTTSATPPSASGNVVRSRERETR